MSYQHQQIEKHPLSMTALLLKDLKQERAIRALTLDADLEQQLGIGSLEKAELLRRIETHYDIQLNESLLVTVSTLQDLINPILRATPGAKVEPW